MLRGPSLAITGDMTTLDVAQLEAHRVALRAHCYRMLGSPFEADDAVQETFVRAWRALDRFDGRSSVKTWLYRIATNVCLDALRSGARRYRPMEEGPASSADGPLQTRPRQHWLEPIADARAVPEEADPASRVMLRQSIRLAFVAALQRLPPKQRAALLLTEVLGWSAAEVAESLETSVASVNSALQRARVTVREVVGENPEPVELSEEQRATIDRYVQAFEAYDVEALSRLLTQDVVMSMPPFTLWLQGPDSVAQWLLGRGAECRGSRLVRTWACGAPAFAQYRNGGEQPWALLVLDLQGSEVAGLSYFLDWERLFPEFDMPPKLQTN